jgi:hypothetical protein
MDIVPNQEKIPDDHLVDANDTGWRKYILVFITMGVLGWAYWAAKDHPVLQGLYATFGGLVITVVGLYFGINLANKVQGGIINLKAYPLTNGDAPPAVTPPVVTPPVVTPPTPGPSNAVPPKAPTTV